MSGIDTRNAASVCWLVAVASWVFACGGALASVQLQPETSTTLHVGETAAVSVPFDRHDQLGFAGNSLTLIKQVRRSDTTIYIYRAVNVGDQTLIVTPADPGPDGCISCVTVHYFARVIE